MQLVPIEMAEKYLDKGKCRLYAKFEDSSTCLLRYAWNDKKIVAHMENQVYFLLERNSRYFDILELGKAYVF